MTAQKLQEQAVQDKHVKELLLQSKTASDRIINYFLVGYFLVGLLFASFYDTWSIAIGVSSLSLLAYYAAKLILSDSNVYQYVLSAVLGIFMAQYIYQMHGMFEMHFVAFISSAILITYHNWKLQIPITIVVVLHHAIFGYLQFSGFDEIYFTRLEYMDLQTFFIHILLAAAIFFICGLWAYHFKKYKLAYISQTWELGLYHEKEAHETKQRIYQEKIVQSEANLKTFFSNTHAGFLLLDSDYHILAFNRNAEKFASTIFNQPMYIGKNYFEFIPDARKENIKKLMELVRSGSTRQYEVLHKHFTTGKEIWIDVSMHPVLNHERKFMGISIAYSNITEKKLLEEQVTLERAMKQKAVTEAVLTAQENERAEIGRELHDNINQILTASCLYLNMAREKKDDNDALLARSATYTNTAIEEIRKLAKTLITPLISDMGLIDSVKSLTEDIMLVHPIEIKLATECFPEEMFNEKFKLNLFRIIQEQINNTLKHAQATQLKINFHRRGDQLCVSITDNGVGFKTSKRKKGVGLINIISRAELYKGNMVIDSKPGKGCSMSICFSLEDLSKHNGLKDADAPDMEDRLSVAEDLFN